VKVVDSLISGQFIEIEWMDGTKGKYTFLYQQSTFFYVKDGDKVVFIPLFNVKKISN
jgi:hypothetical protein